MNESILPIRQNVSCQSISKYNPSAASIQVFAGDDQQSYYFNTITREISWEKPAGYVETVTESKPKAVSKSKRSHRDDKRKPTPKKYPFPELEIEKIELITSYDAASDKSTDDNESNGAASVSVSNQFDIFTHVFFFVCLESRPVRITFHT